MNTSTNQDFTKDFAKLVRDVRQFIQQDMLPATKKKSHPFSTPTLRPVLQTQSEQKDPPETEKPKLQVVKSTTSIPSVIKGDWELHAMSPPEGSSPLPQKLAAYTSMHAPPLQVLLVLPEDNNPHRLFLENVSRAVTRTFASASVVLYHDGLLGHMEGKLLLAPLFLFQKKFPKAQIHIPLQEEGMTWIPLENLDIYAHDVTAKRALWMSIQRSFQS